MDGDKGIDLVAKQTFQEKLDIVSRVNRPLILAGVYQQGKWFVRHFQTSNCELYPWLTASEKLCKLYVLDCLLLATNIFGVWSYTEFAKLLALHIQQ